MVLEDRLKETEKDGGVGSEDPTEEALLPVLPA